MRPLVVTTNPQIPVFTSCPISHVHQSSTSGILSRALFTGYIMPFLLGLLSILAYRSPKNCSQHQFMSSFVDPIIFGTIEKIRQNPSASVLESNDIFRPTVWNERPNMVLPCRGKLYDQFDKRLRKIEDVGIIFTTRKLKLLCPHCKRQLLQSCEAV